MFGSLVLTFVKPLVVENIEKQRQPYPNLEAIYILTPCSESASRLVDDFARKGGPMYAAAHVHFTNGTYAMTKRSPSRNA
jgi:hypothetical protein